MTDVTAQAFREAATRVRQGDRSAVFDAVALLLAAAEQREQLDDAKLANDQLLIQIHLLQADRDAAHTLLAEFKRHLT